MAQTSHKRVHELHDYGNFKNPLKLFHNSFLTFSMDNDRWVVLVRVFNVPAVLRVHVQMFFFDKSQEHECVNKQ